MLKVLSVMNTEMLDLDDMEDIVDGGLQVILRIQHDIVKNIDLSHFADSSIHPHFEAVRSLTAAVAQAVVPFLDRFGHQEDKDGRPGTDKFSP